MVSIYTPGGGGGGGDNSWARHRRVSATANLYTAGSDSGQGTGGTTAITANRLYAVPLYLAKSFDADAFQFYVATAVAFSARVGLYRDTALYPAALEIDIGTVSVGTTGYKLVTFTQRTLTAGVYWLALVSDGGPTLGEIQNLDGTLNAFLGSPASSATNNWGWDGAHTYAALPDPFPAAATLTNTGNRRAPWFMLRLVA